MSNIKQTIIAAAVAVTFTTTAQADGLSDSLPLGKSLAAGHELPLSLGVSANVFRSEEHTSELQSRTNLVCRLLLEKKKKKQEKTNTQTNNYSTTSTIVTKTT